jgi:hypothetical protein
MSFEQFAVVDYGQEQEEEEREQEEDMGLPGRGEWVEARHFMGIMFCWTLLECFDFLYLSPTTQGKLHGSISVKAGCPNANLCHPETPLHPSSV